jgi:hypothetical protein
VERRQQRQHQQQWMSVVSQRRRATIGLQLLVCKPYTTLVHSFRSIRQHSLLLSQASNSHSVCRHKQFQRPSRESTAGPLTQQAVGLDISCLGLLAAEQHLRHPQAQTKLPFPTHQNRIQTGGPLTQQAVGVDISCLGLLAAEQHLWRGASATQLPHRKSPCLGHLVGRPYE